MADEKDEKKEPEIITPVGPGATDSGFDVDPTEDIRQEADARDTEADSEDEDERAGHTESDEGDDRDALRQRRRGERQKRRKRQNLELNFLRQRNEDLERRQSEQDARITQTEVVTIDGRIAQVEEQIRESERIKAQAITKGDGDSAAEADRIREQLLNGKRALEGVKNQAVNGARQRQAAPTIDPQIKARVDDWISDNNDWFDPNLGNEDSAIARAIEDSLFREKRLDPRTDAYWVEYNRRLGKRLPHLFDQDSEKDDERQENRNGDRTNADDRPAKRNGGPRMTTGGRERTLKKNEVYISAERRKAMEEAGLWEDETLRNRYLKRYQQYDKEHGSGRGRH